MGAILAALTGLPQLFEMGKSIYNTVTGKPSTAETPEQLVQHVSMLPADQQAAWTTQINAEIERQRLENARIQNEQGDVTEGILKALAPETAAKVAEMRMTTRPWVVRRMMHVILLPFYVLLLDTALMFLNGLYRMWSAQRNWTPFDLFAEKLFGEGSLYTQMYNLAAPTAAAVVMTYIIGKSVEVVKNAGGGDTFKGALGTLGNIVKSVKAVVGK